MSSLKVWSKFSATRSDGTKVNLRIQDMPPDRYDDVIDFLIEHLVKHEQFYNAAGIPKNPKALKECRDFITERMKDPSEHVTICCLDDSDTVGDILGISVMGLTKEDEEHDEKEEDEEEWCKTQEMNKVFEIDEAAYSGLDIMEQQNVKLGYNDRGLAVHPDFMRLGIATELFKVRESICRDKRVPLTWACMTSLGSQKAAEKLGWQTASAILYDDLAEKCGVTFEGAPMYHKIMYLRID